MAVSNQTKLSLLTCEESKYSKLREEYDELQNRGNAGAAIVATLCVGALYAFAWLIAASVNGHSNLQHMDTTYLKNTLLIPGSILAGVGGLVAAKLNNNVTEEALDTFRHKKLNADELFRISHANQLNQSA